MGGLEEGGGALGGSPGLNEGGGREGSGRGSELAREKNTSRLVKRES